MYVGNWELNMCNGKGTSYDHKGNVLHTGNFFKNRAENHCCSRFCALFGFHFQNAVDDTFKVWTSDGLNVFRLANFNNSVLWKRDSLPGSARCIPMDKVMQASKSKLQRHKSHAKSMHLIQDKGASGEKEIVENKENKVIPMSIKK